ncbi:MAG: hypothetical protein NT074_04870 [Methanomicrobiales archaeon]|nr:hypothetical protein [Methanomicrobiales archaeon]
MPFSLERIGDSKLFLVLSSAATIRKDHIDIIKTLIGTEYRVLVVTTNQPYVILKKIYGKEGINLSKTFFVDAITKYATGSALENTPDCRFINNPANLTDMGIAINETLNTLKGEQVCILLDSISTMLIYIPSINISKFIHFITSKLRLVDAAGIFLAVEKGLDPLLMTQLSTFVDETVDMEEDPHKTQS